MATVYAVVRPDTNTIVRFFDNYAQARDWIDAHRIEPVEKEIIRLITTEGDTQ